MTELRSRLFDWWLRRHWRADPEALSAFAGLRPLTLVTGASEGIGLALAQRLADEGADLLLVARNAARLDAVATELQRTAQGRVDCLPLDLTSASAIVALDQKLVSLGAYVDVLVANAGMGLAGPFADCEPRKLEALIALNVTATTALSRHLLPSMLVRGQGGILFVSSLGGFSPGPWQAAYFASKAYVSSLSVALSAETVGHGVTITCVAPGPVQTNFHAKMGTDRALYRWLIPAQTSEHVAALALLAFRWRLRAIVPGLVSGMAFLAVKLLPQRLTTAVVGLLLRPRA